MDFPPLLRKSGPPDSPSESSLTSAEDLENRRLEKKLEFEKMKDHFPPDMRFDLLNFHKFLLSLTSNILFRFEIHCNQNCNERMFISSRFNFEDDKLQIIRI